MGYVWEGRRRVEGGGLWFILYLVCVVAGWKGVCLKRVDTP